LAIFQPAFVIILAARATRTVGKYIVFFLSLRLSASAVRLSIYGQQYLAGLRMAIAGSAGVECLASSMQAISKALDGSADMSLDCAK
jgi:hypothetical protein